MNFRNLLAIVTIGWVIVGCSPKDDPTPSTSYEVPSTYNFDPVSYSGQTNRLNMLDELSAYAKTAHADGVVIGADKLQNMYANENDPFTTTYSQQLKSKTFELDVETIEGYLKKHAEISSSNLPGSNGVAGRIQSLDGSKQYLFDENGRDLAQYIEKGIMGAVFYYQATAVYLSDDKIGAAVDNETSDPEGGTEMEHHWDEAFGYFGAPKDFPTNVEGIRFWGKYCNNFDAILGSNQALMDALIKGRAAISNKDMDGKEEAIMEVRNQWERVVMACVIHYINVAKANLADDAIRNHALSEAHAFLIALKYNPSKSIGNVDLIALLSQIDVNFYEIEVANLDQIKITLAQFYDLEQHKDSL